MSKRPEPICVGKFVFHPSDYELKRIRAGHKGAFCYEHELPDTTRRAARHAVNLGAGSWTIFPMLEDQARRVIVEFYNWKETGIYNFERPFLSHKKNFYWWFDAKLPEWWTNPQWKHVAKEHEKAYDPRG